MKLQHKNNRKRFDFRFFMQNNCVIIPKLRKITLKMRIIVRKFDIEAFFRGLAGNLLLDIF